MITLPTDTNAKGIQALRFATGTTYATTTTAALSAGVVRLYSAAGGSYGISAAASVPLPAEAVEYVAVREGDTITTAGSFVISEAS